MTFKDSIRLCLKERFYRISGRAPRSEFWYFTLFFILAQSLVFAATRYLRELRLDDADTYEVGQNIEVGVFAKGDSVDVTGTSKGHGYSSPIIRWNQHTGPMAHGSKYHRGVGSLSANSDPSRVFKNKHMAGQWGHERVTVQNLEVVRVDGERNLLFVKGALPGPNGGLLVIRDSVKA